MLAFQTPTEHDAVLFFTTGWDQLDGVKNNGFID
jgi:hypothetical protein